MIYIERLDFFFLYINTVPNFWAFAGGNYFHFLNSTFFKNFTSFVFVRGTVWAVYTYLILQINYVV